MRRTPSKTNPSARRPSFSPARQEKGQGKAGGVLCLSKNQPNPLDSGTGLSQRELVMADGILVLVFRAEVAQWVARLRVSPRQIRLQPMRHKWTSCSPNGTIAFSLDLLHQPAPFRDYAIVFALLHLRDPKHGTLFHTLLRLYVPNSDSLRPQPLPSDPSAPARTL